MQLIEALEQAIAAREAELVNWRRALGLLRGEGEAPLRRGAPPLPQGGEDSKKERPALTKPFREAKKAAEAVEIDLEGVVIAVSPLQKQMIMALADADAPITRATLAEQLGTSVATVADHITRLNTGALLTTTCIIKSYHNGMVLEQRA